MVTQVKHQREVGTSYFDAVSNTISREKVQLQQWMAQQSLSSFNISIPLVY